MNGHDWLLGLDSFYKTWFPEAATEGSVVPGFWFGARKASYRGFFEKLEAESLDAARVLASLGSLGKWRWEVPSLVPLRMRAAIFLDQTCRNHLAMQRGQGIAEANHFKELCDAVALRLAVSVLVDVGFDASNVSSLLKFASVPELCFLSLVLRHAREPFSLKLSEAILRGILHKLSDEDTLHKHCGHMELCSRFLEETQDAKQSLVVEAYLEKALSSDKPQQLVGKPGSQPRVSVLDARCQRYAGPMGQTSVSFLSPLKATNVDTFSRFREHFLVDELRKELSDLGYLDQDVGIVLSLSGGVDSMVTCCLLWLLEQTLPPQQRFRWCAMHLCHPNRDDARDEEGWVQWSCSELGVDLLSYRPQIRRPHGSIRTGISRERMSARGSTLNVTVLRPLLKVRKQQLIAFADLAQDSTPKWSRRGWIRYVLDEMKAKDAALFEHLLSLLSRAGSASEALGEAIDSSLNVWKSADMFADVITVPPLELSGEKNKSSEKSSKEQRNPIPVHYPASKVSIVVLKMPALFKLSEDFQSKVQVLMEDFRQIATIWNEAISQQTPSSAPPEEDEDDHPGSCPLQPIRVASGPFEMGPFVLGRATCVAMNSLSEMERLLKGQLPARKSLKHLWDCVVRARREHHWGTMHKSCPFLYAGASGVGVRSVDVLDVGMGRKVPHKKWCHLF
eukprot:Skav213083  [mRNA]  locus=scaffold1899:12269:16049:+ [translate_table: standard]